MLTISTTQLEVFRLAALDQHAVQLAAGLAASGRPGWAQREDLPGIVHRSVLWAWQYGLRTDSEFRAFAELALHVGEHFHAYPAFHEILVSDADDKLAALHDYTHPHQWQEAAIFSRAIDSRGKEMAVGH